MPAWFILKYQKFKKMSENSDLPIIMLTGKNNTNTRFKTNCKALKLLKDDIN